MFCKLQSLLHKDMHRSNLVLTNRCTCLSSMQAQQLNKEIFECIYYAALKASCELSQVRPAKQDLHMGAHAALGSSATGGMRNCLRTMCGARYEDHEDMRTMCGARYPCTEQCMTNHRLSPLLTHMSWMKSCLSHHLVCLPPTSPPTSPPPPQTQGPYESYKDSPVSKGVLQHDMWGVKPPSDR
jgi:hypothetical protein